MAEVITEETDTISELQLLTMELNERLLNISLNSDLLGVINKRPSEISSYIKTKVEIFLLSECNVREIIITKIPVFPIAKIRPDNALEIFKAVIAGCFSEKVCKYLCKIENNNLKNSSDYLTKVEQLISELVEGLVKLCVTEKDQYSKKKYLMCLCHIINEITNAYNLSKKYVSKLKCTNYEEKLDGCFRDFSSVVLSLAPINTIQVPVINTIIQACILNYLPVKEIILQLMEMDYTDIHKIHIDIHKIIYTTVQTYIEKERTTEEIEGLILELASKNPNEVTNIVTAAIEAFLSLGKTQEAATILVFYRNNLKSHQSEDGVELIIPLILSECLINILIYDIGIESITKSILLDEYKDFTGNKIESLNEIDSENLLKLYDLIPEDQLNTACFNGIYPLKEFLKHVSDFMQEKCIDNISDLLHDNDNKMLFKEVSLEIFKKPSYAEDIKQQREFLEAIDKVYGELGKGQVQKRRSPRVFFHNLFFQG